MDDFGDFSGFASFEECESEVQEVNKNSCVVDWQADFQFFEEQISPIEKQYSSTKKLLVECFKISENILEKTSINIEDSYKSSLLSGSLQSQILDPVKSKSTSAYSLLLMQIQDVLNVEVTKEDWLINVSRAEIGTFRSNFNFFSPNTKTLSNNNKIPLQNSDTVNNRSPHLIPSKEILLQETDSSSFDKTRLVVKMSFPDFEFSIKQSFEDLSQKPLAELRSLVSELDEQAKIYSEVLLTELDNRDSLKRQNEIMNNFISSHVAVEQKLSQQNMNKKKSRYAFLRYPEEKGSDFTIPYFNQDECPVTSDLSIMTEILKAIEREDPQVPKLISDYVFQVGNRYELETVIKVRTDSGTPVG